LDNEEPW
jgi:hypothetical protein